jgi:PAS domain S-box-containing protein
MRLSHSSQIIVVAVLALHIVVIAAMGSAPLGITFSNALQFAACLAAVAGCAGAAARQTGYFRRFWILQSCGLVCWAAGDASFIYYTNLRHVAIPAISATDFLYLAAYLPLAATVFMSHQDNTRLDWLEILDIIQVVIVVSSLYLYLLVVLGKLSADRSGIWNKELVYWYFDANLALLSGYLFRVISAQGDVRRLFGWISVSLVTFLAADTAYAYGVTRLHLSGGTWLDLGYTCSFAATTFIAARWRRTSQSAAESSVSPEWVRKLMSLLPTLAPMLVLLLAIPVASRRPAMAWTVLACSMVCLSMRLAVTQYQQQRASEKLECSERHFRALLEKSSDAIALLDRQGKILYLSPSFEHLLGYIPQERMGFDSIGRVHPDDQNRLAADMATLYATPGGSSRGEYRSQHKDGRWMWIEGVATNLIDDPNVAAVVVNFRDITERKRAAERFAKAFRAHPTPMSIARLADAKALDVNEAWLRLGGFSREEVVGRNARQLNVWVHPEEREALMGRLRYERPEKALLP